MAEEMKALPIKEDAEVRSIHAFFTTNSHLLHILLLRTI
jgi:hypothetical protein